MDDGPHWEERPLGGSWEAEAALFDSMVEETQSVIRSLAADNGRATRANHAKPIGATTRAQFTVATSVPPDLRHGLFARTGATFPGIVRFSNASSRIRADDSLPDLRGLALRVLADDGGYDFLATNADPNHARTAIQTMATAVAAVQTSRLRGTVVLLQHIGIARNNSSAARRARPVDSTRRQPGDGDILEPCARSPSARIPTARTARSQ